MPQFTVDTHLFRELGELLVGRDSTALVELVKNSYDADASTADVYGESLDSPDKASIKIVDSGTGMTDAQFEEGFLRIASRTKDQGTRLSPMYGRRFTGAKGIGRLAAHKLARILEVDSTAVAGTQSRRTRLRATIDWDAVESVQTLDDVAATDAITVTSGSALSTAQRGTTITLRRLRRAWTPTERTRFLTEVETYEPPGVITSRLPTSVVDGPLLFKQPRVRDTSPRDAGFLVRLHGDFAGGEQYWQTLVETVSWVIEVDSRPDLVTYLIAPTRLTTESNPAARRRRYETAQPEPLTGPFFHARILVREGRVPGSRLSRAWVTRAAGIRVYMEGFRVLPYGEPNDDWLYIDADYTQRRRDLPWLPTDLADESLDRNAPLSVLRNTSYYGAVFLTERGAPSLRMLVNREGFVPEGGFYNLVKTIRSGIDLSVRVRAAASFRERRDRREQRTAPSETTTDHVSIRALLADTLSTIAVTASEARQHASSGNIRAATKHIDAVLEALKNTESISTRLSDEAALIRVLASVGTQMAAFVHEVSGFLATVESVEAAIARGRALWNLPPNQDRELRQIESSLRELRHGLERQSAYLLDVTRSDARRRRSRQSLSERFDAAARLFAPVAAKRSVEITNKIPHDLKSPPMFPAELTAVFSNLLSNAVKAAGLRGRIEVSAVLSTDETAQLLVQNTGASVDPRKGERWFRPFESTTLQTDPLLGQGLGLGLPITRSILREYGGQVKFVEPHHGFKAAIEITLPLAR